MTGFWVEGYEAFRKSLRDELEGKVAELKRLLKTTSDESEQRRIVEQMRDLKREYRIKVRHIGKSLF